MRRKSNDPYFENHKKNLAKREKESSQFNKTKINKVRIRQLLNDPTIQKIRGEFK